MRGRGYAMSNEYSAEEKRLAVLTDADNVSPAYIKVIIDEATARVQLHDREKLYGLRADY